MNRISLAIALGMLGVITACQSSDPPAQSPPPPPVPPAPAPAPAPPVEPPAETSPPRPVDADYQVRVIELQWPDASQNILANPSFEEERGWSMIGDRNLVDLQGDDPADGARCVSFTSSNRPRDLVGLRSAPVMLESPGPLMLTGQFRVEGGLANDSGSASVRTGVVVQWLAASGSVIAENYVLILNGSFENWRRMSRRLTPPDGAAALQLITAARCESAGAPPVTISVDDFALFLESDVRSETVGIPEEPVESPNARVSFASSPDGPAMRLDILAEPSGDEGAALIVEVWAERSEGDWQWHPDLIRSEAMGANERHAWTITADQSGELPLSILPVAAITSADETIGVTTDPGQVSIHELFAERDATVRIGAAFHLGVTPGRAELVSVWFHEGAAALGVRGVFQAQREICPDGFFPRGEERRTTQCGVWNPGHPVPRSEDFGVTFTTTESLDHRTDARGALERADNLDATLMQYILPWADEPSVAGADEMLPSLTESLAFEAEGAGETGSRRDLRLAGARSLLTETNGDALVARVFKPSWRRGAWTLSLPLDLSLDIVGGRGSLTLDHVRAGRDNAALYNHDAPPVQMDNFMMDTPHLMLAESHLMACEGALTYSPNTLQPAAPLAENHVRWLTALGETVGPDGLLSANVLRSGVSRFGVPLLDVTSFEAHASPLPERSENWSLEELAWRRAMAGARPVAAVLAVSPPSPNGGSPEALGAYGEEVWHRCLAFGIVPTIKEMWSSPAKTEAARPLYVRLIPVVGRMAEAGWDPLPLAECDAADVIIERFGSGDETLLAIHSTASRSQSIGVTPNWEAIGLTAPEAVEDLVSGEMLTIEGDAFTVTLDPGRTAVASLHSAN